MMQRKSLIYLAAGLAALVIALTWAFAPRAVEIETVQVTQGLFEQSIEEDGRTRLKERFTVSAPVTAVLARSALREGDRVALGDTVAVLTPVFSSLVDERSVREATARLNSATAGVDRAVARVERAKVALEQAKLELRNTEKLAKEGFAATTRLETDRLALMAAQRDLDMAIAEREVSVQDKAQAAAALRPVVLNTRKGRPVVVQSPVSGVVLRIVQPSETTVAAGAALVEVGDVKQLEVVCELLTTDATQARPGSRAVIERWGGPALEGRVRLVEPGAFTKISALGVEEQRVKVLIDIVQPPEAWDTVGDGFRVSVRIITSRIEQAVQVPVGAIFPLDDGMAVYRIDGKRAVLQPVEIGARNTQQAWVRSGLSPGQVAVVYPPATLSEARTVRVRKP
jgi:HlyD family secretion protein